jgi:hypothetical protein
MHHKKKPRAFCAGLFGVAAHLRSGQTLAVCSLRWPTARV